MKSHWTTEFNFLSHLPAWVLRCPKTQRLYRQRLFLGWKKSTSGSVTCASCRSTRCISDPFLNPPLTATILPIIFDVDRRLGTNETLVESRQGAAQQRHQSHSRWGLQPCGAGFLGVSRSAAKRRTLPLIADWFQGIDFTARSPFGDPFRYEGWNGNFDLVKLNPHSPEVKRPSFSRHPPMGAGVRYRRLAPRCGRLSRSAIHARALIILPFPATRFLVDGRGRPRRLQQLGKSCHAGFGHELRML